LLQVRDEYQLRSAKQPVVTCFIGGSNLSDKVFEVSKFLAKFDIGPKFNFVVEESQQFLISKIMKKHDLNFHIPTPNLDRILLESDSVICGAGSSVLEMHCIGIPTAYIPVADNQLSSLRKILENHSGILLTENPNTNIKASKIEVLNSIFYDNEIRTRMFNKSRSVVDGLGKKRLVNSIFS
jgi:spore coat polysaccharide biosynthesis predicted glycosyltransferase SpsG